MNELDAIKLEGTEYIIINEQEIKGVVYVSLVSSENPEDFCIRKIIIKDGKEMLAGLDSDEEFDMAFKALSEKIQNS